MSFECTFEYTRTPSLESAMTLLTISEGESMNVDRINTSKNSNQSLSRSKSYKHDLASLMSSTSQDSDSLASEQNLSYQWGQYVETAR
mmetsp:Transcript_11057/g.17035  ORF Transcript_11057/g.17035 Transcript_11057/m.17035 type:complete len:88 (+) Transcript_11057:85-348(+)